MIFTPEHVQLIAEGRKTQTRRVCKQGEELRYMLWYNPHRLKGAEYLHGSYQRAVVYTASGRIKWLLEQEYAVQPGRGKPAVARIRITDIRQEPLQDISRADVKAEGIGSYTFAAGCLSDDPPDPRWKYIEIWDRINTRKGTRWQDNPLVWALTFEAVR